MGLFNNRKKNNDIIDLSNAIQINDVDPATIARPFFYNFGTKKGRADYSRLVLWIVLSKIFTALKNISWRVTKTQYTAMDIVNFIEKNAEILIYHYWKNGFACVIMEKSGNIRLPYTNELRLDANGRVVNKNACVVYSDLYTVERLTHFYLLTPWLRDINDNMNNGNFITNQNGLFGVLSGSSMPMSPASKQELQEKLKKNYGFGDDQYNFVISNADVKWTPIEVPVDKLELDEKSENDFKYILNLFGINPDYILNGSTFNNKEAATKDFYRTAIEPIAEVLLRMARSLFIELNTDLEPSTIITYDFANIAELKSTLATKCSERSAYVEYLLKLRDVGVDISGEVTKLGGELKTFLADV